MRIAGFGIGFALGRSALASSGALCLAGLLGLAALGGLTACHAQPQVAPEPSKKLAKKAKKAEAAKKAEVPAEPEKFVVPFAWEAGKEEPLALTRAFLRDAITDNEEYMEHGAKFFAAFAERQSPRATVVTCADSRVHNQAWDSTPENDDFTIRNIGNQVENVEGSVEYGIDHLQTPLLLIVGHTGCGAVKAAMGDTSTLSEPIRKELEHLHVPPATPGKAENVAWAEAVIANVNNQVLFSLKRFGREVHEGKVTIVGAVYDFRNDLGQGAGKLVIVNVNGNPDPERMISFVDAVISGPQEPKKASKDSKEKEAKEKDPKEKDSKEKEPSEKKAKADPRPTSRDVASEMAKIRELTVETTGAEPAPAHVAAREAAAHEH